MLTIVGILTLPFPPAYEFNLLKLQADGLESVEFEQLYIEKSERSTWYAAFVADSLTQLDRWTSELQPLQERGIVGNVESVRDFLGPDVEARSRILAPAHAVLAAIALPDAGGVDIRPHGVDELSRSLERLDKKLLELAAAAGLVGRQEERAALEGLRQQTERVRSGLTEATPERRERLRAYEISWFEELRRVKARFQRMLQPREFKIAAIPAAIRRHFISKDRNRFLLYAYPLKDIWREDSMTEFVDGVREIDPHVTGTPIQVYESARIMRDGFLWAALYSLIAVFVLLCVDLRSIVGAALVLLPLVAGLFWMTLLMPTLGLSFNLANFFALPILIGVGVDGGVHMLHRFREVGSAHETLRTTGSAVTLSSLTTMIGFGALLLADHRGIASLGGMMVLGCATLLLSTTVLLPAVLAISTRRRKVVETPAQEDL